jgi:hypothetical protein
MSSWWLPITVMGYSYRVMAKGLVVILVGVRLRKLQRPWRGRMDHFR